MKVLFSDRYLPQLLRDDEHPVGGWCVQLNLMLRALSQEGHHAGVLTWKGANAYVGRQSICDLIELPGTSEGLPKLRFFSHRVAGLLSATRAYAPDLLFQSCSGLDTGLMAFAAWWLNIPFVHRIAHDWDTNGGYRVYISGFDSAAFRYGLRRADLVVCQNAFQRDGLLARYPEKSLLRLDNMIEVPRLTDGLMPRAGRGYVAWLGNFKFMKNVALLERMARKLPHIEFRVAGGESPNLDQETTAALTGLKQMPNVRLMGYVKRNGVFPLLAGATALLCTSRAEGFPNTFLEALAMGTPVITPAVVDPNSMIARNNLGLVSADEAAMAANLQRLWSMAPGEFAELANRCRTYVVAHHSPANVAKILVPALEQVVDKFRKNRKRAG